MLEAARMVGTLLKQGWRPKRTIVFASWDAEEWGLMGSTEYVEQDSAQLSRNGAAYFNFDMVVGGPNFGASGAPSLRPFLRDITKSVRSPVDTGKIAASVYDAWRRSERVAADTAEPDIGDPGGGSDFAGFYNHLGIPIMDWGFSGPDGIYHSAYDSYHWVAKFGDPGFHLQATMGVLGALAVMRAADADVLPYDYAAYARAMRALSETTAKNIAEKRWRISLAPLDSAIGAMETAARGFNAARDASLARGRDADSWKQANATLLRVERVFVRPEGLPVSKREWFRNVIYAADNDNGYANIGLPSINEAVQSGDQALTTREISDLAARFRTAAALLNEAARSLR
jgi:N-acetylated-alpha-linked acidic dipeptidase